jgi:glycogen debranching enzyme
LFAGAASVEEARVLAATLDRWAAQVTWLVPSTDPAHASFEPLRYWRGPVWAVVNWMIAEGFADAGNAKMAARIRDDTRRLIDAGGLSEYFDPTDGKGVGGADFSWTAAIWLLLEESASGN